MLEGGWQRARERRRLAPGAPALLAAGGWLLGAVTTASVIGSSHLQFGWHSPVAHLVLDTVDACIALLVTYLLWGRFRRTRRRRDLSLTYGFLLLGLAGLVQPLARVAVVDDAADVLGIWSAAAVRAVAAVLVLCGAVFGTGRVSSARRWLPEVLPLLLVVLLLVALWRFRTSLPDPMPQEPPASASHPVLSGHPGLLAAQAVGAVAFGLASLLFARRAAERPDALLAWLGPACAVAAFARVNYFLFPSLYSDWFYTGDLLRTGSHALLLVGAAREIGDYWSGRATAMVVEDRRRLARELHDGVVQELGLIRSVTLGAVPPGPLRDNLVAACDRAVDEARAAVDALGRSPEEPLGFVLHRAARQVADRYGGRVIVDLDDSIHVPQGQRHALVRITREAVSNAIRHGEAGEVRVGLQRDLDRCRLVVQDDGRGFDPRAVRESTGFGLTSMRERATALPGTCEIASAVGRGTSVTVSW